MTAPKAETPIERQLRLYRLVLESAIHAIEEPEVSSEMETFLRVAKEYLAFLDGKGPMPEELTNL